MEVAFSIQVFVQASTLNTDRLRQRINPRTSHDDRSITTEKKFNEWTNRIARPRLRTIVSRGLDKALAGAVWSRASPSPKPTDDREPGVPSSSRCDFSNFPAPLDVPPLAKL